MRLTSVSMLFFLLGLGCVLSEQLPQNGDIRLADGSDIRGRLEVYINNTWGTVCYSKKLPEWEKGAGRAACRQLGYQDVNNVATVTELNIPAASASTPVLLFELNCPYATTSDLNNELEHILRCSYKTGLECSHSLDMGIECTADPKYNLPYNGEVRLVSGGTGYPSSGVLETYVNERWVTVCAGKEDRANTAHTICRQMGYTDASGYGTVDQTYITDAYPGINNLNCELPNQCLSSCLQGYPPIKVLICNSTSIYTVNCTFDLSLSGFIPGSEAACSLNFNFLRLLEVIGGAVGGLALITVVISILLLLCFFKEGCPLQRWRYRRQFKQIN